MNEKSPTNIYIHIVLDIYRAHCAKNITLLKGLRVEKHNTANNINLDELQKEPKERRI